MGITIMRYTPYGVEYFETSNLCYLTSAMTVKSDMLDYASVH